MKIPFLPPKERRTLWFWFKLFFGLGVVGAVCGVLLVGLVLLHFSRQVPDFRTLADYDPAQITRVYAGGGELLAEYAKERRIYVPFKDIPEELIEAFLAAEDTKFFEHAGYDLKAILRAILVNVLTNKKQGASTITQQVAKTFLLSSERTYTRKIKELILASRIERAFTKQEILELYLNQIYLGQGAYGVAAAAQTYYGKALDELSLQQRAMIAGLPKAPSAYNPARHPRVARLRRDVIIKRMAVEGFISNAEAKMAIAQDLNLNKHYLKSGQDAPHFSEHIRRYIEDTYGENSLYKDGLTIHTTLDLTMQKAAEQAVAVGLASYTKRHGYRGPLGRLSLALNWQGRLQEEAKTYRTYKNFGTPAAILEINNELAFAQIGLPDGRKGKIPFELAAWARKFIDPDTRGPKVEKMSDVFEVGDIVLAKPLQDLADYKAGGFQKLRKRQDAEQLYSLEQIPKAQAALLAIDVKTGAVRAMIGGTDTGNGFNRAIQAQRQVGSSFKPIVYAYALEKGYTPASFVLDAPVVLQAGALGKAWKPTNYSEKIYGPSTMRRGLEKSRNLMTIRMAQDLGIRPIRRYAHKYGITSQMEPDLSTALGSTAMTLLEITSAYSVFPNGGKRAAPYFISHIQDAVGTTLQSTPPMCYDCRSGIATLSTPPPDITRQSEQVTDPTTAYQMTSMLQGVVQRGTGWRLKALGKPVGGKTGTTNDYIDAWFIGFSPSLAIGVWVGFDQPSTLGNKETGSSAAAPIWVEFAKTALKKMPQETFTIPEGITFARIDADTGTLPTAQTQKTLLEVCNAGTEPKPGQTIQQPIGAPKQPTGNNSGVDVFGIY